MVIFTRGLTCLPVNDLTWENGKISHKKLLQDFEDLGTSHSDDLSQNSFYLLSSFSPGSLPALSFALVPEKKRNVW